MLFLSTQNIANWSNKKYVDRQNRIKTFTNRSNIISVYALYISFIYIPIIMAINVKDKEECGFFWELAN